MRPYIQDLEFDEGNRAEMAEHGVREREVWQTLENAPAFLRNKRRHRAPFIMVGPTYGGRFLTVPLAPVRNQPGVWRPATAFDSDADERARYYRAR